MEMLYSTLLIITTLGLAAWLFLGGFVFRKPFILYIAGFVLALAGGYLSYALQEAADNAQVAKFFSDLKMAASFVSYTIAAAGGSLIASGILLKAQHLAKADKVRARAAVNATLKNIEVIQLNAQEMLDNPSPRSIGEQKERLIDLRMRLCDQQIVLDKAIDRLERMDYP